MTASSVLNVTLSLSLEFSFILQYLRHASGDQQSAPIVNGQYVSPNSSSPLPRSRVRHLRLILTALLTGECKKAAKILTSFVDPKQSFGPDKVIPPEILAGAKVRSSFSLIGERFADLFLR